MSQIAGWCLVIAVALALVACRPATPGGSPPTPGPATLESAETLSPQASLERMRQRVGPPGRVMPLDDAALVLRQGSLLVRHLSVGPTAGADQNRQALVDLATALDRLAPSIERANGISPMQKQYLLDALGAVVRATKRLAEADRRVPAANRSQDLARLAKDADRLAGILAHPEQEGEGFPLRIQELIGSLDAVGQLASIGG